jgi:hypothetical protein
VQIRWADDRGGRSGGKSVRNQGFAVDIAGANPRTKELGRLRMVKAALLTSLNRSGFQLVRIRV